MSTGPVSAGTRLQDAVLRPSARATPSRRRSSSSAGAIRLGVFARGEQLPPERELAERLGVSRNTLREAIAALRDSGLVTTRRGRGGGTVVVYEPAQPGAARRARCARGAALDDALTFRRVVEPGAAQAGRHPPALRRPAGVAREPRCREVRDAADPAAHRVADSRLHLAIATLSGSPMLVEAVTRAQAGAARAARGDPGAAAQHRALPRAARGRRRGHPRRRRRHGPHHHGGALRRHVRAAAWTARLRTRTRATDMGTTMHRHHPH